MKPFLNTKQTFLEGKSSTLNSDALSSKKLKKRFLLCVFGQEENCKTELRQWQHIHKLGT